MGFNPEIIPANIEEIVDPALSPQFVAKQISLKKAEHIAEKNEGLIIAADTIVVFNDTILGKPESTDEAVRFLKLLSGNSHEVITGVSIIKKSHLESKRKQFYTSTKVTFSELSDSEINAYIATGSPMDKAGAYGIQDDWGSVFVSRIDGCYYNVVGFPINEFYQTLKAFAPQYLPDAVSNPL